MKRLLKKRKLWARPQAMILSASALVIAAMLAMSTLKKENHKKNVIGCCSNPGLHVTMPGGEPVCIMKTILGLDTSRAAQLLSHFKTPEKVDAALKKGLAWLDKAQGADGGWGAGSHHYQGVKDPHAVKTDPATTSLVAMSLLRTENTLEKGTYAGNLKRSLEYLLKAVEDCPDKQPYITTQTNTQPQTKLGRNIDVILAAQFFTNILRYDTGNELLKKRIEKALDKCVIKIQQAQDHDGSWKEGGWAPVLQSALANNALESADNVGRKVDTSVLNRGYRYQNSNFDLQTKSAVTGKAAGVMLYGLSSTTRASAKESRKAQDLVVKAKRDGKINDEEVTEKNLKAAGVPAAEAKQMVTAYNINKASQSQAVREDVMVGFGNNGGEEFMSFLMTGESMLMQGGEDWKKWYDMMSGKLINIQNPDGSWNGHHCITSPVFCTATCLLILSIHNDMQFSMSQHLK